MEEQVFDLKAGDDLGGEGNPLDWPRVGSFQLTLYETSGDAQLAEARDFIRWQAEVRLTDAEDIPKDISKLMQSVMMGVKTLMTNDLDSDVWKNILCVETLMSTGYAWDDFIDKLRFLLVQSQPKRLICADGPDKHQLYQARMAVKALHDLMSVFEGRQDSSGAHV